MLVTAMSIPEFLDDNMLWIMGGAIAIVALVTSTIGSMVNTRSRERSRREIAAYIAEGSMTPEQGERLIKAVPDGDA